MKKLFSILTILLALMCMVSCEKKGTNDPSDPSNPSGQTDSKDPSTEPQSGAFTISISNITGSSALMSVTPSYKSQTYYFTILEASYAKGMSDAELIQQVLVAEMDYIIEYYSSYNLSYTDLLSTGDDGYEFTDLTASTEYVALTGYIDANGKSIDGKVTKTSFTTSSSSQGGGGSSTGNLTFNIQKTSTGIKVTPSNNTDSWDYYFMEKSQFTGEFESNADYVAEAAFEYYGTTYAAPGAEEFLYSEMLEYGMTAGAWVLIVWGCDNSGVTSKASSVEFTLSSSSYAPARVKAFKGMRGPNRTARMRKTTYINL